jgi:uncharacterized membrane protein YedE/YeeE
MKRFTIAIISVVTLLLFHGAHLVFGFRGIAVAVLAAGLFYGISRALYWRQLRKIHDDLQDIPPEALKLPEAKELVAALEGLDAEAQRDLRSLDHKKSPLPSEPPKG